MPYKREQGWAAQVRKQGMRREKRFKTKKEAQAWETEMRQKPIEEWRAERTPTACLLEWATRYLDYARGRFVVKTYKEKKWALRSSSRTLTRICQWML